uniref:hypothetical protein n=1 Tax=Roseburia sp. TaxID=2049040 RepID=UPI003FED840A
MTVVLWILKIIGIILLCLLGLLFVLLTVVLFVPVRYRIQGEVKEKETQIHIRASWLCHAISFLGDYVDGTFDYILKIFGVRKEFGGSEEETSSEVEEQDDETVETEISTKEISTKAEEIPQETAEGVAEAGEAGKPGKSTERISGKKSRKRSFCSKISSKLKKIRETVKKIWDFIVHLPQKFDKIKEVVTDAGNKNALSLTWRELRYLLRHFKFRKVHTDLEFSAGNPALTGQIFGGIAVIPAFYRYDMHIYPDFASDTFYVRGTFDIKGRIRLIHLLCSVIRLLKEKDVRRVLSQFQR